MSIRKRTLPSGETRWLLDYRDNKGIRRAKQFRRQADAVTHETRVRAELQSGTHVAAGASPTVSSAGVDWITRCELDKLVTSTLRQYRQHLRQHIEPELGRLKLSEVTRPRVTEFRDAFLKEHSRALTRKVLTSLHSIFEDAIARGRATNNPCRGIKVRKANEEEAEGNAVEMPTKDELRTILGGASGRWRPIVVTDTFTGMRGSELRGLKWPDVKFDSNIIEVRRRVDAWGNFGAPKSKAGKRDIPMSPIVANTLKEWKLACPKGDANPLDLVFPAPLGGVLSHACILKGWLRTAPTRSRRRALRGGPQQGREAPITIAKPKFGLHALRHAAAALFIEQGMSPKRVQTIMGHSSIKVTYDLYGYLFRSDDEDKTAMEQIEARLLGS